MKFVTIKNEDGENVAINVDNILYVIDKGTYRTIYMGKDVLVKTQEPLEELLVSINQS